MTRFIPLLISIFGFTVALQGQTYYVKYDASCLNRYEFITDIDKTPYVVYTTNESSGSITQLDIGKEPVNWVKNVPNKLTSCSAISFDKAMALAINNSTVKLYIIRESPTHYNVAPVEKSTYISSDSRSLEVTMEDADFIMDWDKMVSSRNLATPASTKEVYLDGTIKYQCLTGYIFRKKDSSQSEAYKEYYIIPELGIINKRALPYEGASTNALRLDRIGDDLNLNEYIAEKCREIQSSGTGYQQVSDERNRTGSRAQINTKGIDVPTSYGNNPSGPISRTGTHVVQKGETLYSISRRYGVSVAQLKAWNGIGENNMISLGQELATQQETPSGNDTNPKSPTTNIINQSQYHVVKPGESVKQLADMYGYTEDRFRKMNGLGAFERVYAGQKIFTSDCDCPNTEGLTSDTPDPYNTVETERLTARGNPDVYFRPIKVHMVKGSETLFGIARQYDTTVDRILELNGLDKNAKLTKDQRVYVQ